MYAVTPKGSYCLYAHGFRVYFTPFTRVLFAFPSRYWFTIGRSGVFSLGGWSPHVQTGFHVPRPTHFSSFRPFRIQGCHLLRSEEHTSELQSLMRISYAVFCLKKKKT